MKNNTINIDFEKTYYNLKDIFKDKKVIAISSSHDNYPQLNNFCQNLVMRFKHDNTELVYIDKFSNTNLEIDENKLTIVSIPSIITKPSSLDIIKMCHSIIFFEHLGYTLYKSFETMLYTLQQNKIEISGVITY